MNTQEIIDMFYPVETAHVLLPEIKLHKYSDGDAVINLAKAKVIPTQWGKELTYGRVYVGGAHLARYILDNPEEVRGKNVVDLGSGSGVVAIAAKLAGAKQVTAVDRDEIAGEFIRRNAAINSTDLTVVKEDAIHFPVGNANVIMAADVFLDQSIPLQFRLGALAKCGIDIFAASGHFSAPFLTCMGQPLRPSAESEARYGTPQVFTKLSYPQA